VPAAIICLIAILLLSDREKIGSGVEMVRTEAPKSSTIWSAEDDEMLLRMRASGGSFTDIAAKLGRSQASVESRYSSLKKQTESARSFLKH
jgi:DNA-binding NarL/FixJ family response regulator